jgi:hypothetical protein
MSDQNPFQSTATTSNQENQQPQETQQQQEDKMKAIADKNQGDDSLYVSPSDAIMSPASQKLSSFKQRQINKYVYASCSMPAKRIARLTAIVPTGTAATPPAAPSSPATCPPRKTPKKNPSSHPSLTCFFSFFVQIAAGSASKTLFYLYDYAGGEVNTFSR